MTKFHSSCLFPIKFPPMCLPDGLELFERGRQFLKGHWQTRTSYWAGRMAIQLSPPGPWTLTVALLSPALLPSIDSQIPILFFPALSQPPPCISLPAPTHPDSQTLKAIFFMQIFICYQKSIFGRRFALWITIISQSKYFATAESSQICSVCELTGDCNQIVKPLLRLWQSESGRLHVSACDDKGCTLSSMPKAWQEPGRVLRGNAPGRQQQCHLSISSFASGTLSDQWTASV